MSSTELAAIPVICPVCGAGELKGFNHRDNAVCVRCKSFERSRLGWMVIGKLFRDRPLRNAVHFAPEEGIARNLRKTLGEGYRAFDYDPKRYPFDFMQVEQLDLCGPLDTIAPGSQDLVFHNHVLEHLPCDPWRVLMRLHGLLRPGGAHVFSVPVISDSYGEDLDPSLTGQQRLERFGQDDHMRKFGRLDLRGKLLQLFGRDVHFSSLLKFSEREMQVAGIPASVIAGVNSHVVFVAIA